MWLAAGLLTVLCIGLSPVTSSEVQSRVKRVVNGTAVAAPGDVCSWPFIVIVEKRCVTTGDIPLRCAGSIVAADRVLTNKQCV